MPSATIFIRAEVVDGLPLKRIAPSRGGTMPENGHQSGGLAGAVGPGSRVDGSPPSSTSRLISCRGLDAAIKGIGFFRSASVQVLPR